MKILVEYIEDCAGITQGTQKKIDSEIAKRLEKRGLVEILEDEELTSFKNRTTKEEKEQLENKEIPQEEIPQEEIPQEEIHEVKPNKSSKNK